MATQFATGKHALAECDRCGFARKYSELRPERRNGKALNIRVCRECFDGDHPQETLLPYVRTDDPQQLRHPRPEGNLEQQRRITPANTPWSEFGDVD